MRRSLLATGAIINLFIVLGLLLALDYYSIIPWMSNPAGSIVLLVMLVLIVSAITALGTVAFDEFA